MKNCEQENESAAGGLNRPERELEGRERRIKRKLVSEGMELDGQEL
jgi:hypothetical protein